MALFKKLLLLLIIIPLALFLFVSVYKKPITLEKIPEIGMHFPYAYLPISEPPTITDAYYRRYRYVKANSVIYKIFVDDMNIVVAIKTCDLNFKSSAGDRVTDSFKDLAEKYDLKQAGFSLDIPGDWHAVIPTGSFNSNVKTCFAKQ